MDQEPRSANAVICTTLLTLLVVVGAIRPWATDDLGARASAKVSRQPMMPESDVYVSKQVDKARVARGEILHYDITVTNNRSTGMGAVSVTDPVPNDTSYVPGSLSWSGTSVAPQWHSASNTMLWSTQNLPGLAVVEISFDVLVHSDVVSGTPIVNTALWSAYQVDLAQATVTSTVEDRLAVTETAVDVNGGLTRAGDVVRYETMVQGLVAWTQTDVQVTTTLPVSLSYVVGSLACSPDAGCEAWTATSRRPQAGPTSLTATLATLLPGRTLTLTYEAQVDTGTPAAGPTQVCSDIHARSAEQTWETTSACVTITPHTTFMPLVLRP